MAHLSPPIMDKAFIGKLIPQKPPFVMVHQLLYFSEQKIISGFEVEAANLFTDKNVFQAAGLIENMAQTAALHTGYDYYLRNKETPMGYIGSIKKVSIGSFPIVGDQLETTVEVLHNIMGISVVACEVHCNGKSIAKSEMKTVTQS